jgi:hypothetical protein
MADFKLNLGTVLNKPDTTITDFSEALSSWGKSKPEGGFDFSTDNMNQGSFSLDALKPGAGEESWQTKWLGGTNAQGMQTNGIIPVGIGALSGLAGAYLGWQQFNLAKDQMAQSKKIFNLNFGAQAQSVNTQLEDRQRARVASNPTGYQSVGDYMSKNAVKTTGI